MKAVKGRNQTWVLSSWQVVVNRFPAMGEQVVTGTGPYDFKGFTGFRNFYMDTRDGESGWHMPLPAGRTWIWPRDFPRGITPEDTAGYELVEKLDMDYAPRKISLPQSAGEAKEAFSVQKHHLDTNHHVNNCQYIRMAQDFLPEGFAIHQMRAEDKKQAVLQDTICPVVYPEKDRVIIVLNNEEQTPYSIVEFI